MKETPEYIGLPKLYTDEEVMQYLQISIHKLRRLRRCGKLCSSKLTGGTYRTTAAQLCELIESERECRKQERVPCENKRNNNTNTKLETSFSSLPTTSTPPGESAGMKTDRRAALLLAQRFSKRP
jgi:predicted site-specific integrase-resolvase